MISTEMMDVTPLKLKLLMSMEKLTQIQVQRLSFIGINEASNDDQNDQPAELLKCHCCISLIETTVYT